MASTYSARSRHTASPVFLLHRRLPFPACRVSCFLVFRFPPPFQVRRCQWRRSLPYVVLQNRSPPQWSFRCPSLGWTPSWPGLLPREMNSESPIRCRDLPLPLVARQSFVVSRRFIFFLDARLFFPPFFVERKTGLPTIEMQNSPAFAPVLPPMLCDLSLCTLLRFPNIFSDAVRLQNISTYGWKRSPVLCFPVVPAPRPNLSVPSTR